MLRFMISLTFIAAISYKIAAITILQFDVINFCDAAASTAGYVRLLHLDMIFAHVYFTATANNAGVYFFVDLRFW